MTDTLRERVAREFAGIHWHVFLHEADAAIALIRGEVLEEAAAIADRFRWDTTSLLSLPPQSSAAFSIADAIRALKDKP